LSIIFTTNEININKIKAPIIGSAFTVLEAGIALTLVFLRGVSTLNGGGCLAGADHARHGFAAAQAGSGENGQSKLTLTGPAGSAFVEFKAVE
jgi:hypothetical protein